jgi:methionyl-tRNA formyltransferase
MRQVDLFLGSDIGLWALETIDRRQVRRVFTLDSKISEAAIRYGLEVFTCNANCVTFEASDIGFSVHYPRILKPDLINYYQNIYNLHPAYLPWGRGYYPIFWAIWEQTPAGVTLHEINAGIDEGAIVAQVKVDQFPYDTGASLFERVRETERDLFLEFWPRICAGEKLPSRLQVGGGSYHSKSEFYDMKRHCKWRDMDGEELIRLIRAFSFPGFTGLEISLGGKNFEIHLTPITKRNECS